ncbi:hypothetical protein [Streptomyces sp. DSM 40750]|uniref:hypothetical protein n=1 Tax=Streptomyces sp. DSM 40750 TaxID=2801030 RepID=UPI00214B041A|nr:hypothetical protein [Streptomyces sp. DSM 40750]UUU20214.1 hypothetical protein JIX55_07785 [Streptomyces sp. DSM 40750]
MLSPTPGNPTRRSEMRGRFLLNDRRSARPAAPATPGRGTPLLTKRPIRKLGDSTLPHLRARVTGPSFGHDMPFHRVSEMNHLASFLPQPP